MDAELLKQLLRMREGTKLEFKREYVLSGNGGNRNKAELVKDFLSLVNSPGANVAEPSYLILGVSDELNPDGSRQTYSLRAEYSESRFQQIISSMCSPPFQVLYEEIVLENDSYGVVTILPSSSIHVSKNALQTPKQTWAENSIFIRRGEHVGLASPAEVIDISKIKEQLRHAPKAKSQRQDSMFNVRSVLIRTPSDFERTIGAQAMSYDIFAKPSESDRQRQLRRIVKEIFQDLDCIDHRDIGMQMTYLDSIENPLAELAELDLEIFCVILPVAHRDGLGNQFDLDVANYYFLPRGSFYASAATSEDQVIAHQFANQCNDGLRIWAQVIRQKSPVRLWDRVSMFNQETLPTWCPECCKDIIEIAASINGSTNSQASE